jgi:hypothetical protein
MVFTSTVKTSSREAVSSSDLTARRRQSAIYRNVLDAVRDGNPTQRKPDGVAYNKISRIQMIGDRPQASKPYPGDPEVPAGKLRSANSYQSLTDLARGKQLVNPSQAATKPYAMWPQQFMAVNYNGPQNVPGVYTLGRAAPGQTVPVKGLSTGSTASGYPGLRIDPSLNNVITYPIPPPGVYGIETTPEYGQDVPWNRSAAPGYVTAASKTACPARSWESGLAVPAHHDQPSYPAAVQSAVQDGPVSSVEFFDSLPEPSCEHNQELAPSMTAGRGGPYACLPPNGSLDSAAQTAQARAWHEAGGAFADNGVQDATMFRLPGFQPRCLRRAQCGLDPQAPAPTQAPAPAPAPSSSTAPAPAPAPSPAPALMSSLTLSTGTLSPAFDPATKQYTASVANGDTKTSITATGNGNALTLEVQPPSGSSSTQTLTSGQPTDVALAVGTTVVKITAASSVPGAADEVYTVDITRHTMAALSNLSINAHDAGGNVVATYQVPGAGDQGVSTTHQYSTYSAPFASTQASVSYTMTTRSIAPAVSVYMTPPDGSKRVLDATGDLFDLTEYAFVQVEVVVTGSGQSTTYQLDVYRQGQFDLQELSAAPNPGVNDTATYTWYKVNATGNLDGEHPFVPYHRRYAVLAQNLEQHGLDLTSSDSVTTKWAAKYSAPVTVTTYAQIQVSGLYPWLGPPHDEPTITPVYQFLSGVGWGYLVERWGSASTPSLEWVFWGQPVLWSTMTNDEKTAALAKGYRVQLISQNELTLKALQVDGAPLPGFASGTADYEMTFFSDTLDITVQLTNAGLASAVSVTADNQTIVNDPTETNVLIDGSSSTWTLDNIPIGVTTVSIAITANPAKLYGLDSVYVLKLTRTPEPTKLAKIQILGSLLDTRDAQSAGVAGMTALKTFDPPSTDGQPLTYMYPATAFDEATPTQWRTAYVVATPELAGSTVELEPAVAGFSLSAPTTGADNTWTITLNNAPGQSYPFKLKVTEPVTTDVPHPGTRTYTMVVGWTGTNFLSKLELDKNGDNLSRYWTPTFSPGVFQYDVELTDGKSGELAWTVDNPGRATLQGNYPDGHYPIDMYLTTASVYNQLEPYHSIPNPAPDSPLVQLSRGVSHTFTSLGLTDDKWTEEDGDLSLYLLFRSKSSDDPLVYTYFVRLTKPIP